MAQWPKKVRSLPRGYRRTAPEVKPNILDGIYEGLLRERTVVVDYQKQGARTPKEYRVHPLGLVERAGVLNLVCTFNDYGEAMHIVLHRVTRVEVQESKRKRPRGFNLDEYIESGNLGYLVGPNIKLKARVTDFYAQSLVESPLGDDQRLSPDSHGWEKLSVTVSDSSELRGWIRSLGSMIEILGPKKLRTNIAEEVRKNADLYA